MKPIPLVLITGFLGSGKTTFINWLLQKHFSEHISVIVNEFGSIQLEKSFITQHSDSIVELANGCMCCVAKSDIPRVVSYILEHSPNTEYIIVEASGLSDPDPIKQALEEAPLNLQVYLSKTVGIIDSANFLDTYQKFPLLLSQAADADTLLLSKLSVTNAETQDKVRTILKANLQLTPIIDWTENMDIATILLSVEVHNVSNNNEHHHKHEDFQEYWFTTDKLIDIEKLKNVLLSLKDSVYRAKGKVIDQNGNHHLVQFVNGEVEIISQSPTEENPQSTILFLGKVLDAQKIQTEMGKAVS